MKASEATAVLSQDVISVKITSSVMSGSCCYFEILKFFLPLIFKSVLLKLHFQIFAF